MKSRSALSFVALSFALGAAALSMPACEVYNSPPRPSIEGLVDGGLADPSAPIVIRFSEPVDPASLKIQVVKLLVDAEGNLGDEDDDPDTNLQAFFGYDPSTANIFGGTGEFAANNTAFVIRPNVSLPIGPSLAVLIEPGLRDLDGADWAVRQRIVFSYRLSCGEGGEGTDLFPSGFYYLLANVEVPIETQIQLLARIDVDPDTGKFVGQFTNADRQPDGTKCDPPCDASEACRTLPAEECVVPSTKAGTEDEWPDFVPNPTPPVGYSFKVEGCVVATSEPGTVAFVNLPADVDIQQPDVFVQGIQLTASFQDVNGAFRGTGAVTAERVFLGTTDSGAASGTVVAMKIPDGEEPANIPYPEE
ncbi:MAG: hypothetical protein U0271_07150 [Polyangiaceae bacterium]